MRETVLFSLRCQASQPISGNAAIPPAECVSAAAEVPSWQLSAVASLQRQRARSRAS